MEDNPALQHLLLEGVNSAVGVPQERRCFSDAGRGPRTQGTVSGGGHTIPEGLDGAAGYRPPDRSSRERCPGRREAPRPAHKKDLESWWGCSSATFRQRLGGMS